MKDRQPVHSIHSISVNDILIYKQFYLTYVSQQLIIDLSMFIFSSGAQRLSELLKQPFDLYKPGWFDQYVMGMVNELPQAMDKDVTDEVSKYVFFFLFLSFSNVNLLLKCMLTIYIISVFNCISETYEYAII